jgi:hypothetical protein
VDGIHTWSTLEEFIDLSDDPAVCGNILDAPSLRSACPYVIRYLLACFFSLLLTHQFCSRIADDSRAFELTMHDCFTTLPTRYPKNPSKPYKEPTEKSQQHLVGAQVIRLSTWKIMQWNLITHAGFVTEKHKDANGMCTWVYAHVGTKIWAIVRPKYTTKHSTWTKQRELHRNIMGANTEDLSEYGDVFTTFLEKGQILFVLNSLCKILPLTISSTALCHLVFGISYTHRHHAFLLAGISSPMRPCI